MCCLPANLDTPKSLGSGEERYEHVLEELLDNNASVRTLLQRSRAAALRTRSREHSVHAGADVSEHVIVICAPSLQSPTECDLRYTVTTTHATKTTPAQVTLKLEWRPTGGTGGAAHWRVVLNSARTDKPVNATHVKALMQALGTPVHVAVLRALVWSITHVLCQAVEGGWSTVFPCEGAAPEAYLDVLYEPAVSTALSQSE